MRILREATVRVQEPSPLRGRNRRRVRRPAGEDGYILIAVLFLAFLVLLTLAIAAPKVTADLERDREVELIHRGKQYQRAIQLYYKKFSAYPPNMEALEKSNNIRFLRKRYKDPITGKDEWHLIHFGENKSPTAMGFFGQALGGGAGSSTLAGTGPGGVGQSIGSPIGGSTFGNNAQNGSQGGSSFGNSSGFGSNNGSSFGNSSGGSAFGNNSGSSSFGNNSGSNSSSSFGNNSAGTGNSTGNANGSTDPNAPNTGNGAGNPTGGTTDPNSGSGGSTGSIFGNGNSSGSGQTFGGGGIIGVESTSPKTAILEYKKKKHFNEWEFVYDPQAERMMVGGNLGTIGQPVGGTGNTVNSPSLNNSPNGAPTPPVQQQQQQQQQPQQ